MNYQYKYSTLHGARTLNLMKRTRKAEQVLRIIIDYVSIINSSSNIKNWHVLDIGCSSGMFINYISENFKSILGIDIDQDAIDIAEKQYKKDNIKYSVANIDDINIDENFDLIICNSVLEHVPDKISLLNAIYKHLKIGGICFLSVPNKYTLFKEPHYDLYLLSWFPKTISNLYLKVINKGDYYYETPPSYQKLKRLCKDFIIHNYTIERIKHPEKYALEWRLKKGSILSKLPFFILRIISFFSPSFVFILEKK